MEEIGVVSYLKLVGLGRDELRELDSISMSDGHRIMSSHTCAQQ
jgi:hypothetical protein